MRLFGKEYRRIDRANYAQDGVIGFHNTDWMKEPRFQAAYKAGQQTGSYPPEAKIHWRVHVLNWAADVGRRLEGDFVECGVNKGGFSLRSCATWTSRRCRSGSGSTTRSRDWSTRRSQRPSGPRASTKSRTNLATSRSV